MASKSRGGPPSRRDLLARSGLALGAAALAPAALAQDSDQVTDPDFADGAAPVWSHHLRPSFAPVTGETPVATSGDALGASRSRRRLGGEF